MEGNLRACQQLLNDELSSSGTKRFMNQNIVDRFFGVAHARAKQNAFAQRQSVGLHRATAFEGGSKLFCGRRVREGAGSGGGNAIPLHELLGENFGGLELRGLLIRAPNPQSVLSEQIHNAKGQRIVGTDDRKVGLVLRGKTQQARQIFGADGHAFDARPILCQPFRGDASVSGRAPQAGRMRRLSQLPDQRMFPSAGPYDQQFHRMGRFKGNPRGEERIFTAGRSWNRSAAIPSARTKEVITGLVRYHWSMVSLCERDVRAPIEKKYSLTLPNASLMCHRFGCSPFVMRRWRQQSADNARSFTDEKATDHGVEPRSSFIALAVLMFVLTHSGCAVHYYNAKTGDEY